MSRFRTVLATLLVLAAAGAVAAQSTGSMKVIVVDKTDQTPLPGAVVILTNTQQLIAETVQRTDRTGVCDFPILRAGGGYVVEVQMAGFAPVRQLTEVFFEQIPALIFQRQFLSLSVHTGH